MSTPYGRNVWFDLMTTDPQGARAFYGEVLGWTTTSWPGSDYDMWSNAGVQLGGIMRLPDDAGAPPHWIGYVATRNVDETAKRAQQLGGKVLVPGTDIPGAGRFAVLQDPQGAAFAVHQSGSEYEAPDGSKVGNFAWCELNTTDWDAAWRFYAELFGWKATRSMDMGPELGTYFMFGTAADASMGGMSNAAASMHAPPHWLYYVNVASCAETVRRIEQRGGKVLNGPMEIPGGWIVQAQDPQGAMFAVTSQNA